MASDWIPISIDLPSKREVALCAAMLRRSRFEIVGWLVALWGWFSRETCDGITDVDVVTLARTIGVPPDFLYALENVGWLIREGSTTRVANWDRWLSNSAKARRGQAIRQSLYRQSKGRSPPNVATSVATKVATEPSPDRHKKDIYDDDVVNSRARDGPPAQAAPSPSAQPPPGGHGSPCAQPTEGERHHWTPWDWWQCYACIWPRGRPFKEEDSKLLWRVATRAAEGDLWAVAALEALREGKPRNPGAYLKRLVINLGGDGATWVMLEGIPIPTEILCHRPTTQQKPVEKPSLEDMTMTPEERKAWDEHVEKLRRSAAKVLE